MIIVSPVNSDQRPTTDAIGSRDPNRFHPGVGTVFLKLIGEAISTALARFPA